MTRHEKAEQKRLEQLEQEFAEMLPKLLRECAGGRWGLFVNSPVVAAYMDWPEAERLRSMARQIRDMRSESGETNPLAQKFLQYLSRQGENVPGEPKLAAELLTEVEAQGEREARKREIPKMIQSSILHQGVLP